MSNRMWDDDGGGFTWRELIAEIQERGKENLDLPAYVHYDSEMYFVSGLSPTDINEKVSRHNPLSIDLEGN